MQITRKSILTGNENTMELPITMLQVRDWLDGEIPAFQMFPELSPEQLDFLVTGMIPSEYESLRAEVRAEAIASGEMTAEEYAEIDADAEAAYA